MKFFTWEDNCNKDDLSKVFDSCENSSQISNTQQSYFNKALNIRQADSGAIRHPSNQFAHQMWLSPKSFGNAKSTKETLVYYHKAQGEEPSKNGTDSNYYIGSSMKNRNHHSHHNGRNPCQTTFTGAQDSKYDEQYDGRNDKQVCSKGSLVHYVCSLVIMYNTMWLQCLHHGHRIITTT